MRRQNTALLIIGGIFLLIGLPFTIVGNVIRQDVGYLQTLPVLTVAGLENSSIGQGAVVEGRISERNPLLENSFVAYVRYEYRGADCDPADDDADCEPIWIEQERVTPRLWLDLPDGRLELANENYAIIDAPERWQSTAELVEYETTSMEGLKLDNPVFIFGEVVTAGDAPAFQANSIYGGAFESYIDNQRVGSRIFLGLGLGFCLIGGILFVIGVARNFL